MTAVNPSWEQGESYYEYCTTRETGPAEGLFYYDDDRNFRVNHELEEPWPAHFRVTRRAQDVGKTVTFVVRVEHNRRWENPRHADWPTDPVTGNRYQEFPVTLTGNQRQVVGRIELVNNGRLDPGAWEFTAEIKRIEDVSDGTVLTAEPGSPVLDGAGTGRFDAEKHHSSQVSGGGRR